MSRLFLSFAEAEHEIRRELAERSIIVHPETMQDKVVGEDLDFRTKEIQNFQYTVTQPRLEDLSPTQPWADREYRERISCVGMNPGTSWTLRPDVWDEFIEKEGPNAGKFSYSYPERLGTQLEDVIDELKLHPNSRQLFVAIWDRMIDPHRRGKRRVPCSLGYYYLWRQNRLDVTYSMRSCDFVTHWANDVWLARKIQEYVAERAGLEPGFFTQIVYSLHVYAKDVADEF